jgi:hypothetical protein
VLKIATKYVSRIQPVKEGTEANAAALVRWGLAALQGMVRMRIVNYPTHPLVDTGFMLGSVSFVITGKMKGIVYVGAEYAGWVEFGTSRRAATPFFVPAVEDDFRPLWRGQVRKLIHHP